MQKKALVILADGFEEIEAVAPIDILRRGGVAVTIAGLAAKTVKSTRGLSIIADCLLTDINVDDFDAVVLPGGSEGAKNIAASKIVTDILLQATALKKIIAAICASPAVVLAPLGILDGRQATCYPGHEKDFHASTAYAQAPVVTDGHVITSQAAGTTADFSFVILETLRGNDIAAKVKSAMMF